MKHETSNGTPELSAALLERAKTGDREALAGLYTATELEIYRTVHAILKDEELCRDVQQDAYLRAFSRLEELRDPAAFLPWLRQIAVNEARMQLRRKRPLLFSELSVEPDAGEPELPDLRAEASPELSLERKENARLVREILDGLPEGQRLLLGMFYYEQIPIKEIAADTGLSEGTVKAQLFRGRKRVETEVKRLEEKGVKLYGLSPLPFLLALLRRQEPAAEAGKTLMAETFTKAGIAPAAEAVGLHVGRSFFQTALGRVVLGVIVTGVVAGGAAGWRWARTNFNLGDVRPTETLEIQLHVDTDEELTEEPTLDTEEPSTEPDTEEDLPPETSEPEEPTEPEETTQPTDPQPTDPAPQPTDPTQPTNPEPTQPTYPAPAGPTPTQATEPPSAEPTETSEPIQTPLSEETEEHDTAEDLILPGEEPRIVSWTINLNPPTEGKPYISTVGHETVLNVKTVGAEEPIIYVDKPSVAMVKPFWSEPGKSKTFHFPILFVGTGSCTVTCAYQGKTAFSIKVEVMEQP